MKVRISKEVGLSERFDDRGHRRPVLLLTLAIGIPVAFALGLTAILSIVIFLTPAEFAFFADFVFASLNDFGCWPSRSSF